jgi:hypothetical protein
MRDRRQRQAARLSGLIATIEQAAAALREEMEGHNDEEQEDAASADQHCSPEGRPGVPATRRRWGEEGRQCACVQQSRRRARPLLPNSVGGSIDESGDNGSPLARPAARIRLSSGERGVALSKVRDFLGHASITTTERYDNQTLAALQDAARLLEDGKTFQNLSSSDSAKTELDDESELGNADNDSACNELEVGGPPGDRTQDTVIKSHVLYH